MDEWAACYERRVQAKRGPVEEKTAPGRRRPEMLERLRAGAGGETLNPARLREGSGGPGAYSASAARPGAGVGSGSCWPPCLLGDLEASFSPERMSTYVVAAAGDREQAVALYAWNTVVSGAFYEPLQGLEIALRHALHGQLTRCYGEAWYDNPEAGLDIGTLERIAEVRTKLARVGQVPTPSRVVADLTFGFWVALLRVGRRLDLSGHRADYERTLWRPALRRTRGSAWCGGTSQPVGVERLSSADQILCELPL